MKIKILLIVFCAILSTKGIAQKTRKAEHYDSKGANVVGIVDTFLNQIETLSKENHGNYTKEQHVKILNIYFDYQEIYLNMLIRDYEKLTILQYSLIKTQQSDMFELIRITRPKGIFDKLSERKRFKKAKVLYKTNIKNTQKFIEMAEQAKLKK